MDPMLEAYEYDSMFGPAEVFSVETSEGKALRLLCIGGGFQSATYLDEERFEVPFKYCKAFDVMFNQEKQPESVLLLGGGAYSYPKHALTKHPSLCMDVVEIDPVVIDIARKHFFVDELEQICQKRLRSFAQDGMEFLKEASEKHYDVVINDSFAGNVQFAPLLSAEGLALSKRALSEGGMYLLNAVVEDETEEQEAAELELIYSALTKEFKHVACKGIEDDEFQGCINYLFMASDAELPEYL